MKSFVGTSQSNVASAQHQEAQRRQKAAAALRQLFVQVTGVCKDYVRLKADVHAALVECKRSALCVEGGPSAALCFLFFSPLRTMLTPLAAAPCALLSLLPTAVRWLPGIDLTPATGGSG